MSTTLFKKLFLYWFIIVGLWSFGFTQFGGPSIWNSGTPNYSCNTSNDCTVKMIYQCYDAGIQCVNNTSKEWSWWRDPMCSLLGPPLRKEPTKYDVKIIDCWCVNNKCTPKKINKTITNSRIIYKAKKIWIMFLIIVLCTSIPLIIGYKVYKKLKKQKLLPQFQPITQDNWVVVPAPKVIVSRQGNQIEATEKNEKWDNTRKWLQKNRITIMSILWLIIFVGPIIRFVWSLSNDDRSMLILLLSPFIWVMIIIIWIWLLVLLWKSFKKKEE